MTNKELSESTSWGDFFNPLRSVSWSDFLHSRWFDRVKQTIVVMSGVGVADPDVTKKGRPDGRLYVIDYFLLFTRQLMIWLSDTAAGKAKATLENRRYQDPEHPYNLKVAALFLAKYVTKGLYLLWTYPLRYALAAVLTPVALLLMPVVAVVAKCLRFCMDKALLFTLQVKTEDNLKSASTYSLCKRIWGEKYYSLRDLNIYFDAKKAQCLVEIYSSQLQRSVTYSFLSKNPAQLFKRISLVRGNQSQPPSLPAPVHKIFSNP